MKKFLLIIAALASLGFCEPTGPSRRACGHRHRRRRRAITVAPYPYYGYGYPYYGYPYGYYPGLGVYFGPGYYPWYHGYWGGGYYRVAIRMAATTARRGLSRRLLTIIKSTGFCGSRCVMAAAPSSLLGSGLCIRSLSMSRVFADEDGGAEAVAGEFDVIDLEAGSFS